MSEYEQNMVGILRELFAGLKFVVVTRTVLMVTLMALEESLENDESEMKPLLTDIPDPSSLLLGDRDLGVFLP